LARAPKKKAKPSSGGGGGFNLFDDGEAPEPDASDEDLPKDEAGRQKIKQQYVDLLGIRLQKLKGRILNRERINKTLEGIYFICARCMSVCHNLDEGLVEDEENANNLCKPCSQNAAQPLQAAGAKALARSKKPAPLAVKAAKSKKKK